MIRVLSLGAGVQSSTLALMTARGDLPRPDCAIFADTGWESDRVYAWLDWLETQLPFPVVRVRRDGPDLGELWLQVVRGERPFSGAPLPGFFLSPDGMQTFYCSKEFKTRVVQREIRRMLGLGPGERGPREVAAEQWLGISADEMERMKDCELKYVRNRFPLIEARMSRGDCLRWMEERQYPEPPRSSCIFCPFRTDAEWKLLLYSTQTWGRTLPSSRARIGNLTRGLRTARLARISRLPGLYTSAAARHHHTKMTIC